MKSLFAGGLLLALATAAPWAGAAPSPWSAITPLSPAQSSDAQYYGQSLAIAGNLAVIGAGDASVIAIPARGIVYTYARLGGSWTEQGQPLTLPGGMANDEFGSALALSDTWLLVSAADNGAFDRCVVYTYVRSGSSWQRSGPALRGPSNADPKDYFGCVTAVSGDTLVVGAAAGHAAGSGRVYVFVRHEDRWAQQGPALAAPGSGIDENFGASVAVDGDTLIIGSPRYADPPVPGAAYVYLRKAGVWAQQGTALVSGLNGDDGFGSAVTLSGHTALVGAPQAYGYAGAVYAYTDSQSGAWLRQGPVWSGESLGLGAYFGRALAISGEQAVVAAPGMSFADGKSYGALLAYGRKANTWSLNGEPQRVAPDEGRYMGQALGMAGPNVVVGAHDLDGAAYALRACAAPPCCASDSECGTSEYCSRTGSCQPQVVTGNPCDCFEPGCRICVDPASCGDCAYSPQPANEEAGAAGAADGGSAGAAAGGGSSGAAHASGSSGAAAAGASAVGGSAGASQAAAGSPPSGGDAPLVQPAEAGSSADCDASQACSDVASTASCGCRLGARAPFGTSAVATLALLAALRLRRRRSRLGSAAS